MLFYLESQITLIFEQIRFIREIMKEFYCIFIQLSKKSGVLGFVEILKSIVKEGSKINEDDLPRSLPMKTKKVQF